MAEGAGLENRYTGNGIVGSNPTLSADPQFAVHLPSFPIVIAPTLTSAERLAGSLLGQALGDALGVVVEARTPRVARAYVTRWLRTGRAGTRGRDHRPFGQYSDDTQFTRELLLTYREAGGFDPAIFARRLAALVGAGADMGAGPGSRAATERLLQGVPWTEAATPAPYAGNGAAMRAGPVGLLAQTPEELVHAAVEQARVTHADVRCAAGAVALAAAAGLAARDGPVVRPELVCGVAEMVRPLEPVFAEAIEGVASWSERPAAALATLRRVRATEIGPGRWPGISIHVVPTVLWSLYAFLRTPDDYWESICTAIWAGGDTDTTAAMVGAMSGARLGVAALPSALLEALHDRSVWRASDLADLARECGGIRAALQR